MTIVVTRPSRAVTMRRIVLAFPERGMQNSPDATLYEWSLSWPNRGLIFKRWPVTTSRYYGLRTIIMMAEAPGLIHKPLRFMLDIYSLAIID